MNSLQHLPEDVRSEFSIDANGQAFATRRAIARLAGVDEKSIRNLLQNLGAEQAPHEIFESFTGRKFEGEELIPDTLASLIFEYYGYECQPRYRSEQAKQVCRAFRAIGFRMWVQHELNWQTPQARTITPPTSFHALDYSRTSLHNAKIESSIVESWVLVTLATKIDPTNSEIYLSAQKLIASQIELPETLSSVTEVCQMMGEKMTPRNLNKMLCEMGLQVLTRDSKGRIQYHLTEASQGLGKLILNSANNGKNIPQLKWYANKLIEVIGSHT